MNKQLHDKARDIHNSQSKEMRNLLCISSAHTQVITLLQLKEQIMDDAKKRCAEIDVWITNIENTSNGLRECIAEYESAIDAQTIGAKDEYRKAGGRGKRDRQAI